MKKSILYILIFSSFAIRAQEKDVFLPKANKAFEKQDFVEAEANYRISESKKTTEVTAAYNLGNTIYKMHQPGEAKHAYIKAGQEAKTKKEKHSIFHNLGNVFMSEKKYQEAVSAYQNALRNDPSDEETRYNYALAKQYLKNNPPPPDQNKENKKDDKKNNQDQNKDKDDKKDGRNKEDQSDDKNDVGKDVKKEKKGTHDDQQDSKPQQGGGISKQRLENILEAVNNEEKKVQEKVSARKVKGEPVQKEKNW